MESEENVIFAHSSEDDACNDINKYEACKGEDGGVTVLVNNEETQSMEKSCNWSDICRVCANTNDHIIPIFEAEGAQHDLCDKIHKYLPIRVAKADTLPLQLCYHCAATILAWHELLEGCLDAEKQLLEMQASQSLKEQNESNLSEVPVEDSLSVQIDKQESHSIGQQEEETEEGVTEGESTLRSDRGGETFSVFLDKQQMSRNSRSIKNEVCPEAFDKSRNIIWEEDCVKEETVAPDVDSSEPGNANTEDEEPHARNSRNRRCKMNIIRGSENKGKCVKKAESERKISDSSDIGDNKLNNCDESAIGRRKEHKYSSSSRKLYKCNECSKAFCVKDSLTRHERIHRDERPFTCHVCGKQFRDSGGLSRHIKDVHAKVKNFSCDLCFNSFSSRATRDDHRRTHTGERPYNCDKCDKSFKSRASLYIHSKLHTDQYPYPCGHCEKKFRRRQEMLVHVSIHTGEKNYSCDVCSRRFRVKTEVARHKLTHSKDKPFVCAKCGLTFRQNRYLTSHVKARHPQLLND